MPYGLDFEVWSGLSPGGQRIAILLSRMRKKKRKRGGKTVKTGSKNDLLRLARSNAMAEARDEQKRASKLLQDIKRREKAGKKKKKRRK